MYVNLKKRKNKKDVEVLYVYLCESVRVDGKVVNTQRYVGSINEERLAERDYSFIEERRDNFKQEEVKLVIDKLDSIETTKKESVK